MATFRNETFVDQNVVVDGNRYEDCTFANCKVTYQGGPLPQFIQCQFPGSSVQLEDAANQTIRYLRGLHRGGQVNPVNQVLADVKSGNFSQRDRVPPPPAINVGKNFGQMGWLSLVLISVTIFIGIFFWYGYVYYPENEILEAGSPLVEEIPMEVMPVLPDDLATVYENRKNNQLAQLASYEWVNENRGVVRIPIEDAFDLMLEE